MALPKVTARSVAVCRRLAAELTVIRPPHYSPVLLRFDTPDFFLAALRERFPQVQFIEHDEATADDQLARARVLYSWGGLTADAIAKAPNLTWVQWIGAGVERVPMAALKERGIVLTNNSGVHAINIAEHVLAMMLAFTRELPLLIRAQDRKEWTPQKGPQAGGELYGSTLLIVGYGQIGRALAERAVGLGMRVVAVSRTARSEPSPGIEVHGLDRLDDLLPLANQVALCLPETGETKQLFDAARIARMKPGSYIYNIGRGTAIDTNALITALESGHLAGAGLDVTDPEPLPVDSPLWEMPNVLLTSHSAGMTPRYWERALEIFSDNLRSFIAGEPMRTQVDLDRGY